MLLDVREVTSPLKVGKIYLVPHVKVKDRGFINPKYRLCYEGKWMPIIGGIHSDPEIDVEVFHIHPDWRFVPKKVIDRIEVNSRTFKTAIIKESHLEIIEPVLVARKMLRTFEFPKAVHHLLEPIYLGKRTGCSSSICPHRGVSLAGMVTDEEGAVICPGHGLRVKQVTGEVVYRL